MPDASPVFPPVAPPWGEIDDVLLDMDGTLLDLAYDNHFWQSLLPLRYAEARGLSAEQAMADLLPLFRRSEGTLAWYCIHHWARETGLDIPAMKQASRGAVRILPGIEDALRRLRDMGKRLWLVTNAHPDVLAIKREVTGIDRWFDHVVSSHDIGAPKEAADFWPALRAHQAFDPARSLFADDSAPVLAAARDYGIAHVIGIRWPDRGRPPRPLAGFASVDAVPDLLEPAAPAGEGAAV